MGHVSAAMLGDMQAATEPMLAEALAELGDEGQAIIDGFFQDIGR